eukprot:GHVO01067133.1.p1 GENE.GHVO01067133.1~~GHVO01067133.1.p1  ORF type:complete len:224 (+),score=21.54 GHVO01067133.1:35-706(+)
MAGYVAEKAANSMFKDVQREWSQTVGMVGNSPSTAPETRIDWVDFNYPPLIRLIHYDISELTTPVASIVRLIHYSYIGTVVMCFLNIIDCIVLACMGFGGLKPVYSILMTLILIPAGLLTFYTGYKGIAISSSARINKYLIYQIILAAAFLIFSILPAANFNGFVGLAKLSDHDEKSGSQKGYYIFAIIIESLINFILAAVGGFNAYRVKTFNPYHSSEGQGP